MVQGISQFGTSHKSRIGGCRSTPPNHASLPPDFTQEKSNSRPNPWFKENVRPWPHRSFTVPQNRSSLQLVTGPALTVLLKAPMPLIIH